jgi:hypothetical protein
MSILDGIVVFLVIADLMVVCALIGAFFVLFTRGRK